MPICSKCGAGISPGAKFCMECGAPVPQVTICPVCGTELNPDAKFCMECGTSVRKLEEPKTGISMGDANAISAQNVVGGNLEIIQGNKEVIHGDKITAGTYNVTNITHEAGFAQDSINIEVLLKTAIGYFNSNNFEKAVELFSKVQDNENTAQYYLGCCYLNGNGVATDLGKAVSLLKRSAMSGNNKAMYALGRIYFEHTDIKNYQDAEIWFKKAYESGNKEAAEKLGKMYFLGEGVNKDFCISFGYFRKRPARRVFRSLNFPDTFAPKSKIFTYERRTSGIKGTGH